MQPQTRAALSPLPTQHRKTPARCIQENLLSARAQKAGLRSTRSSTWPTFIDCPSMTSGLPLRPVKAKRRRILDEAFLTSKISK